MGGMSALAADQPVASGGTGPQAAGAATAEGLQVNEAPVTIGRKALGPWAWDNRYHGPRKESAWRDGSGIGVPELFVGFPHNVCIFGIHAEALGGDFINILSPGSEPGA